MFVQADGASKVLSPIDAFDVDGCHKLTNKSASFGDDCRANEN
jgi:hypothetical protein